MSGIKDWLIMKMADGDEMASQTIHYIETLETMYNDNKDIRKICSNVGKDKIKPGSSTFDHVFKLFTEYCELQLKIDEAVALMKKLGEHDSPLPNSVWNDIKKNRKRAAEVLKATNQVISERFLEILDPHEN